MVLQGLGILGGGALAEVLPAGPTLALGAACGLVLVAIPRPGCAHEALSSMHVVTTAPIAPRMSVSRSFSRACARGYHLPLGVPGELAV